MRATMFWKPGKMNPMTYATATNRNGVAAQARMNSAGFILRSARARSVLSRVARSWRSMTRESPATTTDSGAPSPAASSVRPEA
jgi:hypothetical protein